ncbi:uncharacterized protein B0J16DRAFT_165566 [Fusarium flagelliforme]|nr:uncharacterized protein B0J16DRAFT_165566 [Fusarium flagelliforme]KAH7183653.1 hypothetical protein B0J16DRAFT_165566 [Fusarium flagelliforme]
MFSAMRGANSPTTETPADDNVSALSSPTSDAPKARTLSGPPKARPASSATEILLTTTRKEASEQYAQAAKAEKAYRTKRKAKVARANYNETKEHFREAFSHFKLAFKGLFSVIGNFSYLISEKRENRKQAAEKRTHEKNLERKRKLEEQLAKAEAEAGTAGTAGDDAEDKETAVDK